MEENRRMVASVPPSGNLWLFYNEEGSTVTSLKSHRGEQYLDWFIVVMVHVSAPSSDAKLEYTHNWKGQKYPRQRHRLAPTDHITQIQSLPFYPITSTDSIKREPAKEGPKNLSVAGMRTEAVKHAIRQQSVTPDPVRSQQRTFRGPLSFAMPLHIPRSSSTVFEYRT